MIKKIFRYNIMHTLCVTTSLRNQLENKIHHAWHIEMMLKAIHMIVFKMLSAFDDNTHNLHKSDKNCTQKKMNSRCIMYIAH